MKTIRPGIISVRAVNQYRRRDVLSYLGLRYYLANSATLTDDWARLVASDLLLTRTDPIYFGAYHFKECKECGGVEHRAMSLPGPNEALAEAALLDECSNYPIAFDNPPCVFSYRLNKGENRSGVFRHYIEGLQDRQRAIAKACDDRPNGIVLYTDLKRFYPSISTDVALNAWRKQAGVGGLPTRFRDLGEKIIFDHSRACNPNDKGILTGPMFSHLVGNLVLRELDEKLSKCLPARYFRYVDDITLVGDEGEMLQSLSTLKDCFNDMGFSLHDDASQKNFKVSVSEWLKGRDDFLKSRRPISWPTLIGDLKKFLFFKPEKREELQNAFRAEGVRIPMRDYSNVVCERDFRERIRAFVQNPWFTRKIRGVSIASLLSQAMWLRNTYEMEFSNLAETTNALQGYSRKRNIPKLRYRASRLIYLATDDVLASLCLVARELPELHFHSHVMKAVASGNIDDVLPLGTNAAQATAQPLKAAGRRCTTSIQELSEKTEQALSVFLLNGLTVDRSANISIGTSDLMRFAVSGSDISLMKSAEQFIREIACLHGLTEHPRHSEILDAAFDKDEDMALDAIDQLQGESSGAGIY
jgi:hypothetical protein